METESIRFNLHYIKKALDSLGKVRLGYVPRDRFIDTVLELERIKDDLGKKEKTAKDFIG